VRLGQSADPCSAQAQRNASSAHSGVCTSGTQLPSEAEHSAGQRALTQGLTSAGLGAARRPNVRGVVTRAQTGARVLQLWMKGACDMWNRSWVPTWPQALVGWPLHARTAGRPAESDTRYLLTHSAAETYW